MFMEKNPIIGEVASVYMYLNPIKWKLYVLKLNLEQQKQDKL